MLGDDTLVKLLGRDKPLRELAKGIGTANAARKQALAERQKRLGAVLGKVLGELEKR
ncbi:hypothetical protein D3C84_1262190 [compost metagenome]